MQEVGWLDGSLGAVQKEMIVDSPNARLKVLPEAGARDERMP